MRYLLLGLVVLTGCGSSHLGDGPCVGDASPSCGVACTTDDQCDPGFYCGSDGTCTADCTATGNQCPDGKVCDGRGRCVDEGSAADAQDCPSIDVNLAPVTPTVVLLIDQSGSMTADFGGVSRYQAVHDALVGAGGVVTALDTEVFFRAVLYTSNDGFNGGTCPILTPDAHGASGLADIQSLLENNVPVADTPTGESLDAVRVDMVANPPPADSPPIIVVATDGEPDTCAVPNPQNGQPEAIAAAQAAFAAGIPVIMLGVGTGPGTASDSHLQDMANAGAGLPVGGSVNAPFYRGSDPASLTASFQTIIGGVRNCQLDLDGTVDLSRAGEGIVVITIDGLARELSFGTDWHMLDGDTLELLGQACTDFLDQDNVSLSAQFPCGTVVP